MNFFMSLSSRKELIKFAKKLLNNFLKYKSLNERFPDYQFGRGTYSFDLQVHAWGNNTVLRIGAFCSIASGVQIFLGGEHRIDWVTTYPFSEFWEAGKQIIGHPHTKGDVTIGNDVWIGSEAVILSGVTIGDGAVMGARAVVAKDIPPYAIAVGNPARIIRKRFDDETIQKLLEIKWWDWDENKIERFLPKLLNHKTKDFIAVTEINSSENYIV